MMCLCESQSYVHTGSSVCPTQLSLQLSLRPSSVATKLNRSSSASNIRLISWRRQPRPSAHMARPRNWNSPSTVSLQVVHWQASHQSDPTSVVPADTNSSFKLCFTVRAKPPVGLSFDDAGDRGWRLTWSSPYPSSSSLNKNITYEISYRKDGQSDWTVSPKCTDFCHWTGQEIEKMGK